MTVPSILGSGAQGYPGDILTPAEYYTAIPAGTTAFQDPVFPAATAIIPAGATGPQISAIERAFNEQAHQWKEYKNLQLWEYHPI